MSSAKFASITATLEQRIRHGVYQDKLPTTCALAGEFHVARQTMTNALRPLVCQGILQPAGKSGMLIQRKPGDEPQLVAIVTGSEELHIAQNHDLLKQFALEGFKPFLLGMPAGYQLRNPARFFPTGFSGVFFDSSSLTLEIALYLEQQGIPFLSCNRLPVYPRLNYVECNSFDGITQLLKLVLARGYRRIAFFFPARLEGYERVIDRGWSKLAEKFELEDLPCNHLQRSNSFFWQEQLYHFEEAIKSGPRPDIIIVWGEYAGELGTNGETTWSLCRLGVPVLCKRNPERSFYSPPENVYLFQDDSQHKLYQNAVMGLKELILAKPAQPIHRFVQFTVSLLNELPEKKAWIYHT